MEFAELFSESARQVLPRAWGKGLTSYFDYSGARVELLVSDASLRAAIHRILLAVTDSLDAGFLMFTAEAGPPDDGICRLVIHAAGTGAVSKELDAILERLELRPLPTAQGAEPQRQRKAVGVCPATGGTVEFIDAGLDGLVLSVETHVRAVAMPNRVEHGARAVDATAWLVSPGPGRLDSVERRLRHLGWQTRRFASLQDAASLLFGGTVPAASAPMMLVAAEVDGSELPSMEEVATAFPAITAVLGVLSGSTSLKAREHTRVDIRVLPLSPGELERFTLRVDRRLSNEEARETSPSPFYVQDVKRVLVVDDSAVNQLLLRAQLELLGYGVTVAGDGEDAIQTCLEAPPDAVLMDVEMPVLDGVRATRRLRDLQRLGLIPPFPIVAATSAQDEAVQHACQDAGMDGFLAKPMALAALHEEMHRVLPLRATAHE